MPVLAMSAGKVTAIWGSAYVRQPDGSLKPLHVGDKVVGGERIITDADGLVQISPIKGPAVLVNHADVDKTIAAIEARDEAPAAGLDGGGDGSLGPGLRVDRVAELTNGLSYDFGPSARTADVVVGTPIIQYSQAPNEPGTTTPTEPIGPSPTPPAISINSNDVVVVNEGAGTVTFTVTLDKPSTNAVSVSFTTGGATDTASAGTDYTKTIGTLTFEPGQTTKTVTVPILNDNIYEGPEHFVVTLGDAVNAVIVNGQGTAEILDDGRGSVPPGVTPDDDRPHVVEISNPTAPEGGELNFILKLNPGTDFGSDPSAQHASSFDTPLTLTLTGVGDHPPVIADVVHGAEYSLDGGATFLPLSIDAQGHILDLDGAPLTLHAYSPTTPIIIKVLTTLNDVADGVQSIELSGSSPYDDHPAHGIGTITDLPYLLVQSGEPAVEGQPIVFDVLLTHAIDHDVKVHLDLQNGTDSPDTPEHEGAIVGVDTGTDLQYFDTASGEWLDVVDGAVTLAAGQTLVQVRVATIQDNIAEDTEYIKLHAQVDPADVGLTANTEHANQTAIIDDKPYLLVQSGEPAVEGQPIVFDVVLTHALEHDVKVHLDLQNGTDSPDTPEHEGAIVGIDTGTDLQYLDAASGEWHDLVDGAVTLAAGQTLVQVRVATIQDNIAEDTEYIKLHATVDQADVGLTANTEHANQTAIIDDKPYLLVESGEPAHEGQAIVFDVKLTHAIEHDLTVHLDLQNGTDSPDTPEHEGAIVGVDTGTDLQYLDAASGEWLDVLDGTVTMAAGQTLVQVRVSTIADNLNEDTEYIKLHAHVEEAGLTANTEHANQTAIVDDKPYMLVQSGEPAHEGDPIVFDVVLTHATDKAVSVDLSLHSGIDNPDTPENESATLGVDTGTQLEYLDGASGQWLQMPEHDQITFNPGETMIQVRVATNTDNLVEDTEYIKLQADVTPNSADLVANASQFNQTAIIDTSAFSAQPQALSSTAQAAPDQVGGASSSALDMRDLLQSGSSDAHVSLIEHHLAFDAHAASAQIVSTLMDQSRQLANQA